MSSDRLPSINLKSTFCNSNGEVNQDSVDYVKVLYCFFFVFFLPSSFIFLCLFLTICLLFFPPQNFLVKSSNANFSPHTSVGCAPPPDAKDLKPKIEQEISAKDLGTGDTVVVAHLANYCTASSIFGSYPFLSLSLPPPFSLPSPFLLPSFTFLLPSPLLYRRFLFLFPSLSFYLTPIGYESIHLDYG